MTCNHLRCWMLLTCDMKASTYELRLLIQKHINTSTDSTVRHLLSMIQALLEAALLLVWRLSPAKECVNSYLWVISRILKRNFHNSVETNGVEQHSEQSRKPSSQQQDFKESRNAYIVLSWLIDQPSKSFKHFLLLHFLTLTIKYLYLYSKNYKAVNTYQVFC